MSIDVNKEVTRIALTNLIDEKGLVGITMVNKKIYVETANSIKTFHNVVGEPEVVIKELAGSLFINKPLSEKLRTEILIDEVIKDMLSCSFVLKYNASFLHNMLEIEGVGAKYEYSLQGLDRKDFINKLESRMQRENIIYFSDITAVVSRLRTDIRTFMNESFNGEHHLTNVTANHFEVDFIGEEDPRTYYHGLGLDTGDHNFMQCIDILVNNEMYKPDAKSTT